MLRPFTATLLGAVLLITSLSAAPARALDQKDLQNFIGAAAGLAILGVIINEIDQNANRSSSKIVTVTTRPPHRATPPQATRRALPPLPASCLRNSPVAGTRYVMGLPCLRRSYPAVNRLPVACMRHARIGGQVRYGYSVRCLRHSGLTVRGATHARSW